MVIERIVLVCRAAVIILAMLATSGVALAQEKQASVPPTQVSAAPEPLTEDELEVLVSRIALYPDELVALVSAASLYPLQIVEAARFLEAHSKKADLKPKESWDGSVISLLNYPEIVKMMSEDLDWTLSDLFDAMGAMSTKYNDRAEVASRAYDANRDGFVIAGGAGVLVLEDLERAKARGAKIYAEVVGYGATSDGYDMVAPSGEGAIRCMRQALSTVKGEVDYINTHGTSTPVGDAKEMGAIREVFGSKIPHIQSTKSLTGHSLGAAGVQESIYSLLMMQAGFIGESAHIEEIDPDFADMPVVRQRIDNAKFDIALSNSFGFGGTNATLVFQRYNG